MRRGLLEDAVALVMFAGMLFGGGLVVATIFVRIWWERRRVHVQKSPVEPAQHDYRPNLGVLWSDPCNRSGWH